MDEETIARVTQNGAEDRVLCWGCAEFGQHGHGRRENISGYNSWLKTFSGPWEKRAKFMSCGSSHSVVVTNNNLIYAWGNGHCGQVGCGDKDTHDEPICIKLYANQLRPPEIKDIACGWRHTFVILENGNMFSFGNNQYAQLGYDPRIKEFRENQARPHLLRTFTHLVVDQVACGEKHTLFLMQDGTVGAVGNNGYGQLGCGDCSEAVTLKKVDALAGVKTIACGANHSLAVDNDGGLYCWGFGKACGSKDDNYIYPERKYVGSCRFTSVSGGSFHSVALSISKNVYSWGSNSDGQLGHGERVRYMSTPSKVNHEQIIGKVTFVACGDLYSSAITDDGDLFMWGKNSYVIEKGRQPADKTWEPLAVDTGGYPVKQITCGSWHVLALAGKPESTEVKRTNGPSESVGIYDDDDSSSDENSSDSDNITSRVVARPRLGERQPTIPIGDFYAPTPEPERNGFIPSPDLQTAREMFEINDRCEGEKSYKPRKTSDDSDYPTVRSDSSDQDYRPIAVYISEIRENHREKNNDENSWTAENVTNWSSHQSTPSAKSVRFLGSGAFGEKQEVKLSNGEILPEIGTDLEQTNSGKLLKDHSLPGRQAPRSLPYGLYRSKTLNPVVTKKGPSRSVFESVRMERESTVISNKNIGFVTPEDLRPVPKISAYQDLWLPMEDTGKVRQYRMRPTRLRKTKSDAQKKVESTGRMESDNEMISSSKLNGHNTMANPDRGKRNSTSRNFPKTEFPPPTVFTRSKTFVGGEKHTSTPPKHALKMFPRQHTSMVDLQLCAERMTLTKTFPLKPILKETHSSQPTATLPSQLMTKRNKTFLLMDYNRKKNPVELSSKVRRSPILSAPSTCIRSGPDEGNILITPNVTKKKVAIEEINE